jgi:RNA polymerase-binding transcription factor DksA
MSNYAALEMQLQKRLAEVLQRAANIEGDLRSPHDRDWPERANELQNDEVLEGLDEMTLAEILNIRHALRRIGDGNYGACANCGRPIGAARLIAVPTAVTCVQCTQ